MSVEKVLLRLVIGHESTLLDTTLAASPTHTHRWTVFVRAVDGSVLESTLMTKVVFCLHTDFANPKRVIKCAPFQVTETGYAGFSIPIILSFAGGTQEYTINYDMNLTMDKRGFNSVTQTLEFRNPKSLLRQQLIRYGAYVKSTKPLSKKADIKSEPAAFEKLFGPTISVQPLPPPTMVSVLSNAMPKKVTTAVEKRKDSMESATTSAAEPKLTTAPKKKKKTAPPILDALSTSAPITPQSCDESAPQRRPKSSLSTSSSGSSSGTTTTTSSSDPSRPINTQLLIKLAQDFGADERAAADLVAKSASSIVKTTMAHSPIFTADGSPEPESSSTHSIPSTTTAKRKPIILVANKDKKLIQPTTPSPPSSSSSSSSSSTSSTNHVDGDDHDRLLRLQKTLMSLDDASVVLQVARYIREHTTSTFNPNGTILEFDLCLLNPPIVDEIEAIVASRI